MFDLALTDEQEQLVSAYRSLFERECGTEVVRASEDTGFSPALWQRVVELGGVDMALPEAAAVRAPCFSTWPSSASSSAAPWSRCPWPSRSPPSASSPVSAPTPARGPLGRGPGVGRTGDPDPPPGAVGRRPALGAGRRRRRCRARPTGRPHHRRAGRRAGDLPRQPGLVAHRRPPGHRRRRRARRRVPWLRPAFADALLEWRGLTAALLVGAGQRTVEIGVAYTTERHAFGVPIASFQSIAHRLADAADGLDGAQLLARKAAWAVDADALGGGPSCRWPSSWRTRRPSVRWTRSSTSTGATASCSSTTSSSTSAGSRRGPCRSATGARSSSTWPTSLGTAGGPGGGLRHPASNTDHAWTHEGTTWTSTWATRPRHSARRRASSSAERLTDDMYEPHGRDRDLLRRRLRPGARSARLDRRRVARVRGWERPHLDRAARAHRRARPGRGPHRRRRHDHAHRRHPPDVRDPRAEGGDHEAGRAGRGGHRPRLQRARQRLGRRRRPHPGRA